MEDGILGRGGVIGSIPILGAKNMQMYLVILKLGEYPFNSGFELWVQVPPSAPFFRIRSMGIL